ncbi:MAG: protein translocase subunit SecD, partial [Moorea sp. SIO4E2]|nr:protein translocase subunit SecD [Moorena sp. SIO4E2]
MQKQRSLLALILVLVITAIILLVQFPIRLGLDLQGGAQLTIQINTTEEITEITAEQLDAVKTVIEGRVNALGVSESVVQTVGKDQLLVQLPGVNDPQQAERVLGGTAQLDFLNQKIGTEAQLQVEQQVLQQLQLNQEVLRNNGDGDAIAENQAAINRSNQAILELFESSGLTGKNLQDARPQ